MAEPRILITGTGGPSGYSIIKDLTGAGYELFSGDIDPYATARSPWCTCVWRSSIW